MTIPDQNKLQRAETNLTMSTLLLLLDKDDEPDQAKRPEGGRDDAQRGNVGPPESLCGEAEAGQNRGGRHVD